MSKSIKEQLGMGAKRKALEKKLGDHKMHKVHHTTEYCSHCGEKISTSTRHESGHREYDHSNVASQELKHRG